MSARFTDRLAAICGAIFLIGLVAIIVVAIAKIFFSL